MKFPAAAFAARSRSGWRPVLAAVLAVATALHASPSQAVSIELKDVAPDRIDRQQKANDGRLPLPDTPDVARLQKRLTAKGLNLGDPMFIRLFKEESELELWVQKGDAFVLFATYPVCNWSGGLGPKLSEGDKQAPEGFYALSRRQLHRIGRWPRSLNLGFPNLYDQSHARTGSYILIHGGCTSVGCFAMTNVVMEEIFKLAERSIRKGQRHIPIHAFPFRMTDKKLARHTSSQWNDFWADLKVGYDAFEKTKVPPSISVCRGRYVVRETASGEGGDARPLAVCGGNVATATVSGLLDQIVLDPRQWQTLSEPNRAMLKRLLAPELLSQIETGKLKPRVVTRIARRVRQPQEAQRLRFSCNPSRPSCRKHMALMRRKLAQQGPRQRRAAIAKANKRLRTAGRGNSRTR